MESSLAASCAVRVVSQPAVQAKPSASPPLSETVPAPSGLDADPTESTDRDHLYKEFAPLVRRQEQAAALLPTALNNLPVRQQNVVIWRFYEKRSFEEIAALMGIQATSVRSLLRHSLNNLRKAIGSADVF
jgi:DNA-directed RNA polymerase specialized sigma24 family protein